MPDVEEEIQDESIDKDIHFTYKEYMEKDSLCQGNILECSWKCTLYSADTRR